MRPSPAAVAALAALALAAGCLDRDRAPGPSEEAALGYSLDCSIAPAAPGWPEPCLALASPNESPSQTEVDIAVNPTDPLNVFVASKDNDPRASPCVWAVGQVSKDGGRTWRTVYVGGERDARQPTETLWGWRCITDPILQFEADGTLRYSLQAYDWEPMGVETPGTGTGFDPEGGFMFQAVSEDGGETFPTVLTLHAGDELAVFHDYMRMGVNPATGTVYTAWNQITGAAAVVPVVVAVREDAAAAQPPAYIVAPDSPQALTQSSVVGGADGTVYVSLDGPGGPDATFYLATSGDDGATFTPAAPRFAFTRMGELEDVQYRTGTTVELAVDLSGGPRHGCLHAVWADGSADVADVLHRRSCDGGATWSGPTLVSSGPRGDAQFFPRLAVDGRGTLHAVYHTRAYDPARHLVDTEWAHSTDGGHTWTVRRLTAAASDGDLGIHQNGFPFFGDYIGIASAGDHTYMGFPHTARGHAEIAVAHVVAPPA